MMLVYDLTKEKSFASVKRWAEDVDRHASTSEAQVIKVLVANKTDMESQRVCAIVFLPCK